MRAWARWVLVALTLLWGTELAAQQVDVSVADARILGRQALAAGEFALAAEIARKLIEVNPDDRDALLILAVAAPQLGDADAGWEAGARAWRLSESAAARYEAARVTALAAANAERFTLSTIWLRIALNDTPNEAARAQTLRDAQTVVRRNPLRTLFTFSVVPSNNVNSGSDEKEDDFGGDFSEDAQALAGIRNTAGVDLRYRLQETSESRTTIGLRLQSSRVWLDDDGEVNTTRSVIVTDPDTGSPVIDPDTGEPVREDVPTSFIQNEDFATDYRELSFGHIQALENGNVTTSLAIGSLDFGGERYYDFRRVGLGRTYAINDMTTLQLSAQRELQDYVSSGIIEVRQTWLSTGLSYQLPHRDALFGSVTFISNDSPSNNYAYDEWSLNGSYRWAEPFGPISLSANAGLKWREYPRYGTNPFDSSSLVRREDWTFLYGVTVGLPDVSYAGFTPTFTIGGSVADSNVNRFKRDSFSVNLTMRSLF